MQTHALRLRYYFIHSRSIYELVICVLVLLKKEKEQKKSLQNDSLTLVNKYLFVVYLILILIYLSLSISYLNKVIFHVLILDKFSIW